MACSSVSCLLAAIGWVAWGFMLAGVLVWISTWNTKLEGPAAVWGSTVIEVIVLIGLDSEEEVEHGMFGPAARHRSAVVAYARPPPPPAPVEPQSSLPLTPDPFVEPRRLRPPRLGWASLLRKTFGFEVLHCPCGGRRQVLAAVTDWQHIDEELRKRGLERTLRATVVPTHRGPRQAELALDLAAVPRPRSHAPPRGADLALAS